MVLGKGAGREDVQHKPSLRGKTHTQHSYYNNISYLSMYSFSNYMYYLAIRVHVAEDNYSEVITSVRSS